MIKFILMLLWTVAQAAAEAAIFVILWNWFAVVEPLNLPPLEAAHVMGLWTLFALVYMPILYAMCGHLHKDKDLGDALTESIGRNLVTWGLVLMTASIAHWWM